ncbi:hypothetical protein PINS_up010474 [Pythium insidiosum]|nr:hypothetical protein PINS_up010474 [Pythium insidiosum]
MNTLHLRGDRAGGVDARRAEAKPRFAPVKLQPEQLDAFHQQAQELLAKTIREYVQVGHSKIDTERWRFMRSVDGLAVFRDRRPLNGQLTSLLCAGTIPMSLTDTLKGLYADNTQDARAQSKMFYPRFIDVQVLANIQRRSKEEPLAYTGLKWCLAQSGAGRVVANRDICYFEKIGVIDSDDGRKLGFLLMQSVEIPECPPDETQHVVRAHTSMCYVFEELQERVLGVYMTGTMDSMCSSLLARVALTNFAAVALSVSNCVHVVRAKRFAGLMSTRGRSSRLPVTKHCQLCGSAPSFFESHESCAGCKRTSVCKRCRSKQQALCREGGKTSLSWFEFCDRCVFRVDASAPGASTEKPARRTKSRCSTAMSDSEFDDHVNTDSMGGCVRSFSAISESNIVASGDSDSCRSLNDFSLRMNSVIREAGYDSSIASSSLRLTGLASIGSRTLEGAEEEDEDDDGARPTDDGAHDDRESVIEIRPLRRSAQPPEMLASVDACGMSDAYHARQTCPPPLQPTEGHEQQDLLARLVQASSRAEQTFLLASANTLVAHSIQQRNRLDSNKRQ